MLCLYEVIGSSGFIVIQGLGIELFDGSGKFLVRLGDRVLNGIGIWNMGNIRDRIMFGGKIVHRSVERFVVRDVGDGIVIGIGMQIGSGSRIRWNRGGIACSGVEF